MIDYLKRIKRDELTINSFLLTFLTLVVIRTLLEFAFESGHFLSLNSSFYYIVVDYIHIFISWLTLYFCISFILSFFSNNSFFDTLKITLKFFGIIIIVPLLDYFLFESGKIVYNYHFDNFWFSFMNTFNPFVELSFATKGVRVEIALVLLFAYLFVYIETQKHSNAFFSSLLIYGIIYLYGYLPALYNALFFTSFKEILNLSYLASKSDVQFNLYLYLPIAVLLFLGVLKQCSKNIQATIIDSLRLERFSIYMGLFVFGFLVVLKQNSIAFEVINLFDMQKFFLALLSLLLLFAYSTILNNIYDQEIDRISNQERPLVKDYIQVQMYHQIKNSFLFFALLCALSVNEQFFLLSLFIFSLSYIYSAPPLRLKKHFVTANLILSSIAVTVFLLGFSLVEANMSFINSNKILLLFIFAFVFISANIKDIKDIQGDKKEGVTTLVILLGEEKTMWIIKSSALICLVLFLYLLSFGLLFELLLVTLFLLLSVLIKESERYLLCLQLIAVIVYVAFLL